MVQRPRRYESRWESVPLPLLPRPVGASRGQPGLCVAATPASVSTCSVPPCLYTRWHTSRMVLFVAFPSPGGFRIGLQKGLFRPPCCLCCVSLQGRARTKHDTPKDRLRPLCVDTQGTQHGVGLSLSALLLLPSRLLLPFSPAPCLSPLLVQALGCPSGSSPQPLEYAEGLRLLGGSSVIALVTLT